MFKYPNNSYLKKIRFLLLLSIIICILGYLPYFFWPKYQIHLFLSGFHSKFFDLFFAYLTKLGTLIGILLASALLILLPFNESLKTKSNRVFLLFIADILASATTQIIKHIFHAPRPVKYFQMHYHAIHLHLNPYIHQLLWLSFPSGHSTSAFVIATIILCISKNPFIKTLAIVLALLIAYSRIYLHQHFLIDVTTGALIGIWITAAVCYFAKKHSLQI